jgi:uncharacterized protein YihD (DUF1040 family)
MTCRPDGWQGTEFFDLQTVQNLLETLLNIEIPVKKHHYNEVILSNKMRPITNQQRLPGLRITMEEDFRIAPPTIQE